MALPYPFTAVLGHDELKTALLLTAVDPGISGVLAMGDRGTAKSTLIRALGELLDSPAQRHRLGVAGRRRALDVFSWASVAAQTVSVYQRATATC